MTQNSLAVIDAIQRGFSVNLEGIVFRPDGEVQKLCLPSAPDNQYYTFPISFNGGRVHVRVHRMVAFLKFGEAALLPGVHARHLDGDSLNNQWDNIAIGSQSQNMMDRTPSARSDHARSASRSRSLPDSTWCEIEQRHREGMSFKAIRAEYGIALGTLSYRLSRSAKKTVVR